jgi:hypothetical protein
MAVAITGAHQAVTAKRHLNPEGKPHHFTLSYADETVILEPGKPWPKTDTFKWVTRGLIEEPQSFHVLANGTVEINAERITLDDPEGASQAGASDQQTSSAVPRAQAAGHPASPGGSRVRGAGKVHFRVKLDHLGHMMIECTRGHERAETGCAACRRWCRAGS